MKYDDFILEIHRIEKEMFNDSNDFGRLTRVDLTEEHKCFLVFNLNPNSGAENNGATQELLESPLVFVPQCYDNGKYNGKLASLRGHKNNQTSEFWNSYQKPYALFDPQKVKMFWAVGDEYKKDIAAKYGEIYPECIADFESIYLEESQKPNNVLVFSDFFHICQTDSKKVNPNEEGVQKLLDKYIDYYNPKVILITNAKLRNWIISILQSKCNIEHYSNGTPSKTIYRNVTFLFSPMMWGQGLTSFTDEIRSFLEDQIREHLESDIY